MSTRIELRKFVKTFGALEVIHGIDLTIDPGEFVVFVGPSGCGKSTLLRMIAGLETISKGDLFIGDDRVNNVDAAARGIAMVFQSYALYPHMTVYKNLAFGLETMGQPKADIAERVNRAADILQIGHLLDRKPKQLSGGQRQRVAIGRAIVREPRIFLFDEPLSNLDAELRVQMRVEISQLHKRLGNTMIYVTHDQVEAMTMADKIVVLKDGHIMQVGSPLDLYNAPANRFVAGFIGSPHMNFFTATVRGSGDSTTFEIDGRKITVPRRMDGLSAGDKVEIGIRPEHLRLDPQPAQENLGEISAELQENLGGQTLVYGRTPGGQRLIIVQNGQMQVGDTVEAWFDPANAHVFDTKGRVVRASS
ncbi:carbohydrate ABC transporter ATP-binding protein, CUT1 family [Palleronia marisminoris]|uniref:Maltose/maltodextrin import ATP-binding protein MalK n=1 Tax=Palleronia marisminoris TaxID=315423 RepID=A0A1Y5T510_9RHOB|nr:sn-glycerol-3-phosphate ABC transporter ATP-binding protein UgpC [Palleronia marisminoris]SFH09163.1 carbohydrate ABC transporter ATP-binding protein, CUT1 family [Palleronia marisminoris]SLN52456.1 Maltose/maltodextrin import ATP-binding protein MalK [Palleronia marisminoris]